MLRILLVAMAILALFSSQAQAEKIQIEGVVNINTASPDELRLIPGVGPARVRNILAYRHAHPFRACTWPSADPRLPKRSFVLTCPSWGRHNFPHRFPPRPPRRALSHGR